jgi:hypothetical protein
MFATEAQLRRLTGRTRYSAQIRWLQRKGYKFDVNGLGQPIVASAEINRKLVGGSARQERTAEPRWENMHESAA